MKAWEYRLIPLEDRIRMGIGPQDPKTGCMPFLGRKDGDGYGQVKNKGKVVSVTRWIWEEKHGPLPKELHVLHKCDNPSCVCIDHLFVGSHAQNMADKANKGRSKGVVPSGASHKRPMAKLSSEQVREIKMLLKRGYRQVDIANDFKVSRQIISDIFLGKTWVHIR